MADLFGKAITLDVFPVHEYVVTLKIISYMFFI